LTSGRSILLNFLIFNILTIFHEKDCHTAGRF
jgi:hypothetical protein